MEFAYTIIYVEDPKKIAELYSKTFSLEIDFITPEGDYAQLNSPKGARLAFASKKLQEANQIQRRLHSSKEKDFSLYSAYEIALSTKDPHKSYLKALLHGFKSLQEPQEKPWGQIVAYIEDPNGIIIEICTPMKSY